MIRQTRQEMKITKSETVDVDVTVDVSIADVVGELPLSADNVQEVLRGFNALLTFARSLPDELVSALNLKQREIIGTTLTVLNARLANLPLPADQLSTERTCAENAACPCHTIGTRSMASDVACSAASTPAKPLTSSFASSTKLETTYPK
jgi:hypothetical protein